MSDWREMFGADVLTLGMAADEKRRSQASGRVVTYVRVQTVTAADVRAGTPIADVASEVRLYQLPETLDEAVSLVRALRALAGERRLAAFSMADLETRQWPNATDVLKVLVEAGLQDVAELPADRVEDLSGTLRALHDAGIDPRRITISHPIADRKADIIAQVQRAIADFPAVRRFSPLPRVAPIDKPTTGYDDVRMIALSRLALGTTSIEVDWSLYGPKLAQVALTFGADHLDAVSVSDDPALGRRRASVEDVERNIKAAGFEPQEYGARRPRNE